ncbi:MAG: iron ABC transporter permease, partial [Candidatus Methanoplasma sp.]|nr:iron ABC transporter permease [Candidatus Methanoplasma sp.]
MESGGTDERTKLTDLIRKRADEDTFEGKYNASVRKKILFIISVLILAVIVSLLGVGLGAVDIPLIDVLKVFGHAIFPSMVGEPSKIYYSDFIFAGRLPRVLLVILTGFSLGAAGMIMQGLLRNPLVSPFTLGVSTAASFGAAMAILMGPLIFGEMLNTVFYVGSINFPAKNLVAVLFAFAFAMMSMVLILVLTRDKKVSRSLVILAGVVISYLFQAGITASKYFSDDQQLREITLWIMGSMNGATWGAILL